MSHPAPDHRAAYLAFVNRYRDQLRKSAARSAPKSTEPAGLADWLALNERLTRRVPQ